MTSTHRTTNRTMLTQSESHSLDGQITSTQTTTVTVPQAFLFRHTKFSHITRIGTTKDLVGTERVASIFFTSTFLAHVSACGKRRGRARLFQLTDKVELISIHSMLILCCHFPIDEILWVAYVALNLYNEVTSSW